MIVIIVGHNIMIIMIVIGINLMITLLIITIIIIPYRYCKSDQKDSKVIAAEGEQKASKSLRAARSAPL